MTADETDLTYLDELAELAYPDVLIVDQAIDPNPRHGGNMEHEMEQ